jgi:hypothetical protein
MINQLDNISKLVIESLNENIILNLDQVKKEVPNKSLIHLIYQNYNVEYLFSHTGNIFELKYKKSGQTEINYQNRIKQIITQQDTFGIIPLDTPEEEYLESLNTQMFMTGLPMQELTGNAPRVYKAKPNNKIIQLNRYL